MDLMATENRNSLSVKGLFRRFLFRGFGGGEALGLFAARRAFLDVIPALAVSHKVATLARALLLPNRYYPQCSALRPSYL